MVRTFKVNINSLTDINLISSTINQTLDSLDADFVSISELQFPNFDVSNGSIFIVVYKTRD